MTELLFRREVFAVVGAAIEVHRELGPEFLEAVYQEAFEIELAEQKLPFEAQKQIDIRYKGRKITREYIADCMCYGEILVEIKALERLTGKEESQLLNYLKATGLRVGLLINFGSAGKLGWKRLIR